jgi:hypothetical protein
MPSFNLRMVAAAVLGATLVAAVPTYNYNPEPACQTQLKNADFGFSFSPVPIWKEPWVVGTCKGAGDCEFTGVQPFEGSPLNFTAGGFMANKGATAQVGQSFNLCARDYDYKIKFRSAVLGDLAKETKVTFIVVVDGKLTRIDPIPLTKGYFGEHYIEIPGSKKGGKGFAFFTGATGKYDTLLVDDMRLV